MLLQPLSVGCHEVYILFIHFKTLRQDSCGECSVIGLQMLLIRGTQKVLKYPKNTTPSASLVAYVGSNSRLLTYFLLLSSVSDYFVSNIQHGKIYVNA